MNILYYAGPQIYAFIYWRSAFTVSIFVAAYRSVEDTSLVFQTFDIFARFILYFEQALQTAFGFHVSIAIAFSSASMYVVHIYQQN